MTYLGLMQLDTVGCPRFCRGKCIVWALKQASSQLSIKYYDGYKINFKSILLVSKLESSAFLVAEAIVYFVNGVSG